MVRVLDDLSKSFAGNMNAGEQQESCLRPCCIPAGKNEQVGVPTTAQNICGLARQLTVIVHQHDAGCSSRDQLGYLQFKSAKRHAASVKEMVLREKQLLAHIENRKFLTIPQHRHKFARRDECN